MARETIKLIIVDDHPVFRDGLRQCLEAQAQFSVLADRRRRRGDVEARSARTAGRRSC